MSYKCHECGEQALSTNHVCSPATWATGNTEPMHSKPILPHKEPNVAVGASLSCLGCSAIREENKRLAEEVESFTNAGWRSCIDHIIKPETPCPVCRAELAEQQVVEELRTSDVSQGMGGLVVVRVDGDQTGRLLPDSITLASEHATATYSIQPLGGDSDV